MTESGWSSHGCWSTLGEIRELEVEDRENEFPEIHYPDETPAIWVCFSRREALRYLVLASEVDEIEDPDHVLTLEQEDLLQDVVGVKLDGKCQIVHEDGDGGYLVVRP